MCGLVGMVGMLENRHKHAMRDLLFLNSLRGRDSTGLSSVKRDRKVLTRKMTVPGYEFIEYPVVDRAMEYADQLWIGHGRFRTYGEVSRTNAHPFEVLDGEGDILLIGAHNGTLQNKWEIEQKLKLGKFETDSEALFYYLVNSKSYKEAINSLRGAWSLVWWDPTADSVLFCRNSERPLVYAFTKDRKVMVWASEAWMIINACSRNGVELETNNKGFSCYSTLPDHLYTMEIPQEKDQVLPELKREGGYAGAPARTFPQGQGYGGKKQWNSWWEEVDKEAEAEETKGKKEDSSDTPKTIKERITLGGVRGYGGADLTIAQLKKIVEKGCAWCGDELPEGLITSFLDEENLCCVRCMKDSHPKEAPLDIQLLNDDVPELGDYDPDDYRHGLIC